MRAIRSCKSILSGEFGGDQAIHLGAGLLNAFQGSMEARILKELLPAGSDVSALSRDAV